MTLFDVVKAMRGPKGTQVKLAISRAGKEKDVTISRDIIHVRSVKNSLAGAWVAGLYFSHFLGNNRCPFWSVH